MIAPKDIPPEASLIKYPCEFSIKVMGVSAPELRVAICEIAQRHDPHFDASKITERQSKNNKYLSIGIKIDARSRQQLDALYTDLTACELTLWVL